MKHSRPRTWIIDHLWSDRSPEQGGASYRQCLHELRKAFGKNKGLLLANESSLSFAPGHIWVDLGDEDYLRGLLAEHGELPEFMADLDIRDREFEHWVRDRRSWLEQKLAASSAPIGTDPPKPPPESLRPVIIRERGLSDGVRGTVYNTVLQSLITKSIDETGAVTLVDAETMQGLKAWESSVAFRLRSYGAQQGDDLHLGANLTREIDGTIFGEAYRNLDGRIGPEGSNFDMIDLVNEMVHRSLEEIATYQSSATDAEISSALCLKALKSLDDYSSDSIAKADRLIARAQEIDPVGSYLAWRGYLRTFLLGEKHGGCAAATSEEMESLILKGVELAPTNSMVLSMAAFMRSIWRVSTEDALEFAERSNKLNPANALGISYLGLVHSHIGNLEKGYQLARRAHNLTSKGMVRSSIGYVAMRTAACSGRFSEALRIGEELCQSIPGFVAPKRMMGLLYHELGRHAEAQRLVFDMQQIDPSYDLDEIRRYYRTSPQMKNSVFADT